MIDSPEERAFRALTDKITRARGICCGAYKDRCLKRRIAVRMRARGVHTFADYSRVLDVDAHEYDLLLGRKILRCGCARECRSPWPPRSPRMAELQWMTSLRTCPMKTGPL